MPDRDKTWRFRSIGRKRGKWRPISDIDVFGCVCMRLADVGTVRYAHKPARRSVSGARREDMMRAMMSDRTARGLDPHRLTIADMLCAGSTGPTLDAESERALDEARAILAESEPARISVLPGWSPQETKYRPRLSALLAAEREALADSLRAFIDAPNQG